MVEVLDKPPIAKPYGQFIETAGRYLQARQSKEPVDFGRFLETADRYLAQKALQPTVPAEPVKIIPFRPRPDITSHLLTADVMQRLGERRRQRDNKPRQDVQQTMGRRNFLKTMARWGGAAATTGVAARMTRPWEMLGKIPVLDAPVAQAMAEIPRLITYGKFNGEKVEVVRPTGHGNFVVRDETGQAEIPLESLEIDKGDLSWAKEIEQPLEWLGFDCAQPQLIDKISQIGAGMVRIPIETADREFFQNHPEIEEAINVAKSKQLKIVLMFNPGGLIGAGDLQRRVDKMLSLVREYNNVSFELGNDADWDQVWEDGDLNKFAQFVSKASISIQRERPNAEIVVGAVKPESFRGLKEALRKNHLNIYQFTYALHAYNNTLEIDKAISAVRDVLGTLFDKFIFTELGYNLSENDKGQNITELVQHAREKGTREVIVFQLRNIEFPDENGKWGIVSPSGEWERSSLPIIDYVWSLTHPTNN